MHFYVPVMCKFSINTIHFHYKECIVSAISLYGKPKSTAPPVKLHYAHNQLINVRTGLKIAELSWGLN